MRNMTILHDKDNVGTVIRLTKIGEKVKSEEIQILATEEVPLGHKIALIDLNVGVNIVKYGEVIGKTKEFIEKGALVHIHNVESLRGRGDKNDKSI